MSPSSRSRTGSSSKPINLQTPSLAVHRPSITRGSSTPPRMPISSPLNPNYHLGASPTLPQGEGRAYDNSGLDSPVLGPGFAIIPDDGNGLNGLNGVGGLDSGIAVRKRFGRGMTFEEISKKGILDYHELSLEFDGMELDEKDIKKLPKKLRPYYENLATLKDHYTEVDNLLSGSIPYTVATSFSSPERRKTYTQLVSDLEDEVAGTATQTESSPREGWWRRDSSWRVKKKRDDSRASSTRRGMGSIREGEQVDERSMLLNNGHQEHIDTNGMGDEENGDGDGFGYEEREKREKRKERIAKLALNINTIVNVLLVAAKGVAVLYSSSISLTASLVDSALDLLSTFIILGTSLAIGRKSDRHMYPAGKKRFEPLGVLIFSVAMIASFVQVFIESFKRSIEPSEGPAVDLSGVGMATMLATIGVKSILWFWCSQIPSSGVQALAQDAENDVYFNIMSLAFPYIGSLVHWRLLDPIGGMVLSVYIIIEWVKTMLENFENLSGKAASGDQLSRVLYLVSRFNPVLEIADVECYHIGDDLIVEVDVILPRSSTLHFAHDIGETIQCCLENLEGILRAYVHLDYSSSNPAQHTSRIPSSRRSSVSSGEESKSKLSAPGGS